MANEFKKPISDQYFNTVNDQKTIWFSYPYGVRLESDPKAVLNSIVEAQRFIMEGDAEPKTIEEYLNILKSSNSDPNYGLGSEFDRYRVTSDKDIDRYFTQPTLADTRVGCNDVINPYWQFNRDDDICPPGLIPATVAAEKNYTTNNERFVSEVAHASGMGRVYAETYDSQQQILWIEAGVPRFTNLLSYYRDAANQSVADAINSGNVTSFITKVATTIVKTTVWTFFFPIMSLIWIPRWMERLTNERITKYYTFRSTMTMYYTVVNSMLQYTAVSMGIHPLTLGNRPGPPNQTVKSPANGSDMEEAYDATSNTSDYNGHVFNAASTETVESQETKVVSETDDQGRQSLHMETTTNREKKPPTSESYDYYKGMPEILRNGPDIFRIMNRRSRMIDMDRAEYTTEELWYIANDCDATHSRSDVFLPDDSLNSSDDEAEKSMFGFFRNSTGNWWSVLKGSILGSGNHVGFKIENNATFNEEFSNTTGETGLAEKFNQVAERYKEENELFGNNFAGRAIGRAVTSITEGQGVKSSLLGSIGQELKKSTVNVLSSAMSFDIGSVLVTGNGFLEIPKVWKTSSMSRPYSFSFKLRSRYGDPVSVFQSIYIPMFMLIALAAPRAIGDNAYTSPFLIRAYCKGMFNIPLGIVSSLTIQRGSSEYGWSSQFYPLSVSINMTIEDLSPQLFVSMNDGIFDTFSRNSSMQAYLDTLSSLGLKDMIYLWPKLTRKMNSALAIANSTVFNASYRGTQLGKSTLGKVISAFVPYHIDRASSK